MLARHDLTGVAMGLMVAVLSAPSRGQEAAKEFKDVYETYLAKLKPLTIASNEAWWNASNSGKDADFQKRKDAESKLVDLHSDKALFERIQKLRAGKQIGDGLQQRELEAMYRNFLPNQADPELSKRIVGLAADVEQMFNTHRSKVDAKELSENEVRDILRDTKDSKLAEKTWKGYMEVGGKVEAKLKELVKLRNEVATKLGFKNYFDMQMTIQELDEAELVKTFDELDTLTREPFAALKKRIDEHMMKRFGIGATQLRPWHTGDLFFQEVPELEPLSLDDIYQSLDPVKLAAEYYKSLAMPVEDVLKRSDMYEKPGKSPHAFCTNINRSDDVRVLCNVKPNARWMDTVLHELGHAVYDKLIDKDVPFLLHEPAHTLTTEAIAMMFGSLSKNEEFLLKLVKLPEDRAGEYIALARRSLSAEKLIFSRWTQVMLRFEQSMYANPDQNLSRLWWDLKKKYQLLIPPDDASGPDYGAKMHIVGSPVYYHNYMLGELFAAQLHTFVAQNTMGVKNPLETSFLDSKPAGDYLRVKVFEPGNLTSWRDLVRTSTGEPLTAKYFAQMYVN